MSLSDAELADLAREAVDRIDPSLQVHVAPAANDDPYRWGSRGWTVTVLAGRPVDVWIPTTASPDEVIEQITAALSSR